MTSDTTIEKIFLKSILEILPAGIVIIDSKGVVTHTNPVAKLLLLGLDVGCAWVEVMHENTCESRASGRKIKLNSGNYLNIRTQSLPANLGQLVLLIDTTETRHLYDSVSHYDRIYVLGRMVASLAHQIRTPLSSSLIYAKHLNEKDLSPQKQKQFTIKLISGLSRIERQIQNMLAFSKKDHGLVQSVSVNKLLNQVKENCAELIKQADVSLVIENYLTKSLLHCNLESLVGAISNLIENAAQASPPNTMVCITVQQVSVKKIELIVRDQGVGISEVAKQRVFDPFFTTRSKGSGLGLAIVNTIIKTHGGEVLIHSNTKSSDKNSQGTTVTITMPILIPNNSTKRNQTQVVTSSSGDVHV